MSKFAIVILYEGSKPSKGTIAAVHAALCESGVVSDVEKVEMYDLSEKEIVGAIAAAPKFAEKQATTVSPEAEAVLVIAERYKEAIAERDLPRLSAELSFDLFRAKTNGDSKLTRAVTLLAVQDVETRLSFDTMQDASLWLQILELIRKLYRVCQGQHIVL